MARLPQALDMQAPNGGAVSAPTIDYSGLGQAIENVGAAVERFDENRRQRADKAASDVEKEFRATYEPGFAERGGSYDGQEPGWSRTELAAFDAASKPYLDREELPDAVRSALKRRMDAYRADVGERAIVFEARARGAVAAERRRAEVDAQAISGLTQFNGQFSEAWRAREQGWDGASPGFAEGVLEDYDRLTGEALSSVPEAAKPALEARLRAKRVEIHAQVLAATEKGRDAQVLRTAREGGEALINAVVSNPSQYASFEADLDLVAGAVPGPIRSQFKDELREKAVVARVEGMIGDGEHAEARVELDRGDYDRILSPGVKADLLARTENARRGRGVVDYMRAADLRSQIDADVDSLVSTGRGSGGLDPHEVEDVLGAGEAAEWLVAARRAKSIHSAIGDFKSLTASDIEARLKQLTPDPSKPDYTGQKKAYEAAQGLAARELKARGDDPAAWAMGVLDPLNPADTGVLLQKKWDAAETGDAKARQEYARATLALQELAGVPPGQRRVLTRGAAGALVARLDQASPTERAERLRGLAAFADDFGKSQGVVLRELAAAGLKGPDLAAVSDLADDPVALGRYVAGATTPDLLKKIDKGEEKRLQKRALDLMGPYLLSIDPLTGARQMGQARIDAVMTSARGLMVTKNLSVDEAVKQATARYVDRYVYVDGWRIPRSRTQGGDQLRGTGGRPGGAVAMTRRGAAQAMRYAIAADGANLAVPEGTKDAAETRRRLASWIEKEGRWVTTSDDDGLQLLVPNAAGGWNVIRDKKGAAFRYSWDKLEELGK